MQIDLTAGAYPSLLEAVGLAIIQCDGMERAIPKVFGAALNVSLTFENLIFEAARGLDSHLKITSAAVGEGAPAFLDRWEDLAKRVRSSAATRGKVAHAGLSVHGGRVVIELDDDGIPTGVAWQDSAAVASMWKKTKGGGELITQPEIRALADRVSAIEREIRQLVLDIRSSR